MQVPPEVAAFRPLFRFFHAGLPRRIQILVQNALTGVIVKNRDPRVAYQPRLLRGDAAGRVLGRLAVPPGGNGTALRIEDDRVVLEIPRTAAHAPGPGREAARA